MFQRNETHQTYGALAEEQLVNYCYVIKDKLAYQGGKRSIKQLEYENMQHPTEFLEVFLQQQKQFVYPDPFYHSLKEKKDYPPFVISEELEIQDTVMECPKGLESISAADFTYRIVAQFNLSRARVEMLYKQVNSDWLGKMHTNTLGLKQAREELSAHLVTLSVHVQHETTKQWVNFKTFYRRSMSEPELQQPTNLKSHHRSSRKRGCVIS